MRTHCLTLPEFEEFRDVQIRSRRDESPATFSCNEYGEVWPFVTYGHHAESERLQLKGAIPLLDKIVADVLSAAPTGGRFHLDDEGAYLANDGPQVSRFMVLLDGE